MLSGSWEWFATKPGKRWGEMFFLLYSFVWVSWFALIVATAAYEWFQAEHYMIVGLSMALPCVLLPPILEAVMGSAEPATPWYERYWFKANVWVIIISYIGNVHWTHYFYNLLRATYTFPAWRFNNVPVALIFCTHAYFCFYFVLSNLALRRVWTSSTYRKMPFPIQMLVSVLYVLLLAVVTAFMETWTISSFPYYVIQDRTYMYTVGSVCYSIYFVVAFPMFYRLDEGTAKWSLSYTITNALAACMLVTALLEVWRLTVGGLQGGVEPGTFCI